MMLRGGEGGGVLNPFTAWNDIAPINKLNSNRM